MKRWIAFLMIVTLLLTGCVGCKSVKGESASVDAYVEGQAGDQGGSGSKPQKKPENQYQQAPAKGEDVTPDEAESVTPDEGKTEQSGEELAPDEEQEEVTAPSEEENEDEQNEGTVDTPSTDQPTVETPSVEEELPEEEYPEEEYPEDEEYPEEEEETPEEEEPVQKPQTPTVTPAPQKPVTTTPSKIKVASYNIKALLYGKDTDGIIQELKEIDADIVGLQEVDKNTNRSKVNGVKVHQLEMLAEKLGYPYWSFDKLIDHSGGEYGMAILSRFPITKSTVVQYEAQQSTDHVRKYGRHVLKVGDKNLVFYNTHLCVGDSKDSVSKAQLAELLNQMKNDTYAVLTGDLNMTAVTATTVMQSYSNLTLLNDGGAGTGMLGSKKAAQYIDNIAVTNTLRYTWNATAGTGLEVNETKYSDHNLVYAYVSFK